MRLRNPDDKIQEEGQTQLISTAVNAGTTDNSNCQKIPSSANEENYDVQKPALTALVAVTNKKNIDEKTDESKVTALIPHEPIHYFMLPPNEPHSCDKYGCPREAKYKLGNSYFCDDKIVSHFGKVAKTCKDEGFELIEDL